MHGLAVYVKEGLPFAWDLSLENSADSHLCFPLALLHSLSYFFFLCWSPSLYLCMFFDSSHLTQMRFSQSSHLLMLLPLETLTSKVITGLLGPNTGCFSHQWSLLGARKLAPKNLKNQFFFQDKFQSFKGLCTLLHCSYILSNLKSCQTWYFYSFHVHKLNLM